MHHGDEAVGGAEESALDGPQPKFGQALASNDKEVRDKAVAALSRYLASAKDISELEVRKIWKALFYCFWHSDKPRADYSVAAYANGVRDLLGVLGVPRATLVGHSLGGGVAMQFAYHTPNAPSVSCWSAPAGRDRRSRRCCAR